MKKINKQTGIFGTIGVVLLLLTLFPLSSCSKKNHDKDAPVSNLEKAFTDAGLRTLKERVQAKDFSLPLASTGKTQSLSGYKGKVVFLNFWTTWCTNCRAEMESLEAVYNRYRDQGLEMFTVNCLEKKADVLAFMETNGLSFPVVLDLDGQVGTMYGIQAIPTTFILDREGKIVAHIVGYIDWDTPELNLAMEELLNSVD